MATATPNESFAAPAALISALMSGRGELVNLLTDAEIAKHPDAIRAALAALIDKAAASNAALASAREFIDSVSDRLDGMLETVKAARL